MHSATFIFDKTQYDQAFYALDNALCRKLQHDKIGLKHRKRQYNAALTESHGWARDEVFYTYTKDI